MRNLEGGRFFPCFDHVVFKDEGAEFKRVPGAEIVLATFSGANRIERAEDA